MNDYNIIYMGKYELIKMILNIPRSIIDIQYIYIQIYIIKICLKSHITKIV